MTEKPENSLLLVYNTCGISGRDNAEYYFSAMKTILREKLPGAKIVVSSCMNSKAVQQRLVDEFLNLGVSFNFIEEKLPVNVTFNHTVLESVRRFGRFEGYMYIDSGISINEGTLPEIYARIKTGKYAMIAAETDTDTGYHSWFGTHSLPGSDIDFCVPIGKTINLHAQIFTDELFEAYGQRIIPDIFAGHCTESVFSFMCAAIKRKFCVCRGNIVQHLPNMDGGSSGFKPDGVETWDHVFRSPRTMAQIIQDPDAKACGFGYEECRQIMLHDPEQFDSDLFCKNDRLKEFIKTNLFLPNELMNYGDVKHSFIVGEIRAN